MVEWKYKLDLLNILKQYEKGKSFEEVKKEATEVLEKFRNEYFSDDEILIEVIERLKNAEDTNEFDDALDELYDWADENRVWLGGI